MWILLFLLLPAFLGVACEEKRPAEEKPIPGINNARPYLYPYNFGEHGTVQGTRILENYLAYKPNAPDSRVALWLLGRSYLDMLTRVVTFMVEDRSEEAHKLQAMIARELGLKENAGLPQIAFKIKERLHTITGQDAIAVESHAAVRILDALAMLHDPAYFGRQLDEVANEPNIELAVNARLLIAARTTGLFNHLREVPIENALSYMVTQYPFPCPAGFVAFSQGDRTLSACGFACNSVTDFSQLPSESRRETLRKECGSAYYGFNIENDSATDMRYLSPENFVLIKILLHMTKNQEALSLRADRSPIGALHKDFIRDYRTFITNLSLPVFTPIMSAREVGIELPQLSALREPPPGIPQSIVIRHDEIRLNIANHFRVNRGQITIPEHILGYAFPGRLGTSFSGPFQLDLSKVHPPNFEKGIITALLPLIRDCTDDRLRLREHMGSVIPGAHDPRDPFGLDSDLHSTTQLLADQRTPLPLLRTLLRTLNNKSFRPYELIVWDPSKNHAGSVSFDIHAGPLDSKATLVTLKGRPLRWTLRVGSQPLVRSMQTEFGPALHELFTHLQTTEAWAAHKIYISPDWNTLSLLQLIQTIELLSYDRKLSTAMPIKELLEQPATRPSSSSSRPILQPRVHVVL